MDEQVWTHRIRTDSLILEGLTAQISHRLKRLRQTDLLKPIWAKEPRRWAFFERIQQHSNRWFEPLRNSRHRRLSSA